MVVGRILRPRFVGNVALALLSLLSFSNFVKVRKKMDVDLDEYFQFTYQERLPLYVCNIPLTMYGLKTLLEALFEFAA